jgi:hypothetical protein
VVCGLRVVAGNDPARPWLIRVCPGYGVGPCGDELIVSRAATEDLADWLWTRPPHVQTNLSAREKLAWIALRPVYRPRGQAVAPSRSCGCEEPEHKPSRIGEGYRIVLLWTLPDFPSLSADLCSGRTSECPPCPESCDLVLAGVRIPDKTHEEIIDASIDNWAWRRLLLS